MFQTAILWELVIFTIYWSLLYPDDKASGRLDTPWAMFSDCLDHMFPLAFLITEWCLNRIYFEKNQVWANIGVILFYGLVNLTVTKVRGYPVYPPLSFDSVVSWILAFAILPAAYGFFMMLYGGTMVKFKALKMSGLPDLQSELESPKGTWFMKR